MGDARPRGARGRISVVAVGALVLCIVNGTAASLAPVPGAGAASATQVERVWQPPVPGSVVRSFSPPAAVYGPGHRGVDYATAPGTPVTAAGRGTVVFAGDVAGALHVVVLHRGGVRSSYSFLLDVSVAAGDTVDADVVVGHAGGVDRDDAHVGVLHFGVRVGAEYVDPMTLFRTGPLSERVRLVPVTGEDPGVESWVHARSDEDATLLEGIGRPPSLDEDDGCGSGIPLVGDAVSTVCSGVVAGVDWASARTREMLRAGLALLARSGRIGKKFARHLRPDLEAVLDALATGSRAVVAGLREQPLVRVLTDLVEIGDRFLDWTMRECTPDAPPADGTGGSGHLVMGVGGIDSSSAGADRRSFGLDVDALGYLPDEVHWFSYAADGGAYDASDTHGDLRGAAKRLAEQLRAINAAEPGREVDLIAHSQGGVVVERFLQNQYDASDPTFPPLGTVVTLSSPHEGAPLATAAQDLRDNDTTRRAFDVLEPAFPGPPSDAKSVRQLAEGSGFMQRLQRTPLPEQIELTTIGGTDDVVVPANRIHVPGATEVVVAVDGLGDHSAIHRDERALRAVRAALEQRPPPCTSLLEGMRGAIEPVLISRVEADLGEHLTAYLEVGR